MDQQINKSASIRTIRNLYRNGLLNDKAYNAARNIVLPESSWFIWGRRNLLYFGAALVLSGIIFFFAYNWFSIDRFFKLFSIEAGILCCLIASQLTNRKGVTSKVLLFCASFLVGVFLAVFGQIYQTGADAFELFCGWAALISGWVILSEFAGLWLLWLVILNTGIILYWQQVGDPAHSVRYEYLCFALAALNGLALLLTEKGRLKKLEWLKSDWMPTLLLAVFLTSLTIPLVNLIVEYEYIEGVGALTPIVWSIAAIGCYFCYRFKLPHMLSIALVITDGCIIFLTLIGKFLFHKSNFSVDDSALYLIFAIIILGAVSGAVFWLKKIAAAMAVELKEDQA